MLFRKYNGVCFVCCFSQANNSRLVIPASEDVGAVECSGVVYIDINDDNNSTVHTCDASYEGISFTDVTEIHVNENEVIYRSSLNGQSCKRC